MVAARQIRASDRTGKQRVAHKQVAANFSGSGNLEAHAARAVARGVVGTDFELTKRNLLAKAVVAVDRRQVGIDCHAEDLPLFDSPFVQEQIVSVQMDWRTERALRHTHTGHVVDVGVGEQDVRDGNVLVSDELEQPFNLVAWIDEQTLASPLACDNKPVLVERTDRLYLDYDHAVILAILDDLMFTSKIRSAAQHAGTTVAFARSGPAALERARTDAPTLILLDLNNPRTDPIGTVTALKADAQLSAIPIVGYVSHVDGSTIAAARTAGVDEVLARSAFVSHLADILTRGRR